jgi:hypothetical protein
VSLVLAAFIVAFVAGYLVRWDDQRTRAAEIAILRLLAKRREAYGLDLVDASAGVLGRGTIYVHLEERGLVRSRVETVPLKPGVVYGRRLYSISHPELAP